MSTQRVHDIVNGYQADSPGTIANLTRLLNQGRLKGTGRLVILPVDQGVEHGPARSFAVHPPGYDPRYHVELAVAAGLCAYAAPLGFIEAVARDFASEIPLILKVNGYDVLSKSSEPIPAVTASPQDALRLGCVAVGFTIYPGSARSKDMYQEARQIFAEAKTLGLVGVCWAYPRGGSLSKEGETALDVVAYAAHLACQLGAHIVKVKLPSAVIFQEEAKKIYAQEKIKTQSLADRVSHVVQSAFNGRRLVIFSGGPAKSEHEILEEARGIRQGGGAGSIIGRNAFQRPRKQALALLSRVIEIYS